MLCILHFHKCIPLVRGHPSIEHSLHMQDPRQCRGYEYMQLLYSSPPVFVHCYDAPLKSARTMLFLGAEDTE